MSEEHQSVENTANIRLRMNIQQMEETGKRILGEFRERGVLQSNQIYLLFISNWHVS